MENSMVLTGPPYVGDGRSNPWLKRTGEGPGPVSLPREFQKGEKTQRQGADPARSTASSTKHLISSPYLRRDPPGTPLRGSNSHKRPVKKSISVFSPGLYLVKSNKCRKNAHGLFVYFKHSAHLHSSIFNSMTCEFGLTLIEILITWH